MKLVGRDRRFSLATPGKQVTGIFVRPGEDIKVVDPASAMLAIDTIVAQGEGTSTGPSDLQNRVAHFYRFQELDKGMKIVPDSQSPFHFSFDPSQPVSIDDIHYVTPMVDDPQTVTLDASDTQVAQLADVCDAKYSEILRTMQGYNGAPDKLAIIDETMREFGGMIDELLKLDLHGKYSGFHAGPRFKYIPTPKM